MIVKFLNLISASMILFAFTISQKTYSIPPGQTSASTPSPTPSRCTWSINCRVCEVCTGEPAICVDGKEAFGSYEAARNQVRVEILAVQNMINDKSKTLVERAELQTILQLLQNKLRDMEDCGVIRVTFRK